MNSRECLTELSEQEEYRRHLAAIYVTTVLKNPYIPHRPFPKQAEFLLLPHREALYGGAGGGGKTDALLMAALQYVQVPGYSALILRTTLEEHEMGDGLITRAKDWLLGTDAKWNDSKHQFTFPSGAIIKFGYLQHEDDKYRYGGSAWSFICFDEMTTFKRENDYTWLFSRMRRPKDPNNPLSVVPIRMRGATNPGGPGHIWVKQRFLTCPYYTDKNGVKQFRPFVRAYLSDNPYIDQEDYEESLQHLDPVTRERIKNGDWDIIEGGGVFCREWFKLTTAEELPSGLHVVRFWDLAGTEKKKNKDPDYTATCLLGEAKGRYYILEVRRDRRTPGGVEDWIKTKASDDGVGIRIGIEEEGGASGKFVSDYFQRKALKGYALWNMRPTKSKVARATPVSTAAEAGNVYLVEGDWNADFLDEAELFPQSPHKDQVDALSGAFDMQRRRGATARVRNDLRTR